MVVHPDQMTKPAQYSFTDSVLRALWSGSRANFLV